MSKADLRMLSPLRVLFLAAEATPLVKVGGLADVAGSLPRALLDLPPEVTGPSGIDIRVALPFHCTIDRTKLKLRPLSAFTIPYAHGPLHGQVLETRVNGVIVYLVSGTPIVPEAPVYSPDASVDAIKYTFFSLAMLDFVQKIGWTPHILHANDWHTAPAVYALSVNRQHTTFFEHTSSLLTVHNLPYLGVGAQHVLRDFGLPPDFKGRLPEWARHMPLPLGLLTADHINAVSPGYAREILTPEFGSGLHEFLRARAKSVSGILNGLDVDNWDPAVDDALPQNFNSATLAARKQNKRHLQKELALKPDAKTPLLGMVTRIDNQKGVDLAVDALRQIAHLPWQAVILGTGDLELEELVRILAREYPEKVRAIIRFDAQLARRIYGGADMILVPSRYEPCGLTQMIGMRYGCVPVVRAVGGLRDTVQEYQGAEGSGFVFTEATPEAFAHVLERAFGVYADQRKWRSLQLRGMKLDFSWQRSAAQYYALYQKLALLRRGV